MNHHDNDGAMIAQLMAAFDEVEAAEQRAGLAASTDEVDNGRAFIAAAAQYMFKQSRTPAMAREVLEALLAAVRVRIAAELPKDQIRKLESEFAWTFRFTGAELDALERLMQPAERIVEIKPREVITDRRSIARADLP